MLVAVTKLRDKGRVLKRSELAEPVQGRLIVADWPTPNISNRWMRRADVVSLHPTLPCQLLLPIFDVQIMKVDQSGMYIMGHELSTGEGGAMSEFIQVWRCCSSD